LDQLDKKDWRIPGSDISDWFNYGFDEVTWTAYVRRRREMNEMVDGLGMVSRFFRVVFHSSSLSIISSLVSRASQEETKLTPSSSSLVFFAHRCLNNNK